MIDTAPSPTRVKAASYRWSKKGECLNPGEVLIYKKRQRDIAVAFAYNQANGLWYSGFTNFSNGGGAALPVNFNIGAGHMNKELAIIDRLESLKQLNSSEPDILTALDAALNDYRSRLLDKDSVAQLERQDRLMGALDQIANERRNGSAKKALPPKKKDDDVFEAGSAFQLDMGYKEPKAGYRTTPKGQPTVKDLVKVGDKFKASYTPTGGGCDYEVKSVTGPYLFKNKFPHYSVSCGAPGKKQELAFYNELVAVDGRILNLFANMGDEFFVTRNASPAKPLPPSALSVPPVKNTIVPLAQLLIGDPKEKASLVAFCDAQLSLLGKHKNAAYFEEIKKRLLADGSGNAVQEKRYCACGCGEELTGRANMKFVNGTHRKREYDRNKAAAK